MISKVLVAGVYGVVGQSLNGNTLNICDHFTDLMILDYDGTPEGYQSALVDAQNNLCKKYFQSCANRVPGYLGIDFDVQTIDGIPGMIRWMTVFKEWGQS